MRLGFPPLARFEADRTPDAGFPVPDPPDEFELTAHSMAAGRAKISVAPDRRITAQKFQPGMTCSGHPRPLGTPTTPRRSVAQCRDLYGRVRATCHTYQRKVVRIPNAAIDAKTPARSQSMPTEQDGTGIIAPVTRRHVARTARKKEGVGVLRNNDSRGRPDIIGRGILV